MQNKILALFMIGCGALGALPALAQDDAALVAAGEKIFKRCAACHMIGEGAENRVGPMLTGVVGRKAGSVPDFKYSPAMIKAGEDGVVWNNDELFIYLENPKKLVPGTKMAFAGLKSEDDRHAVIAYIDSHGGEQ